MKHNHETGRSMVEILGVIGVIGVLTIGGLNGFSWGMNKYRDNKIIDGIRQRILLSAMGRQSDQAVSARRKLIEEDLMGYSVSYTFPWANEDLNVTSGKKITLSGLEKKACQFIKKDPNLLSLSQEANNLILINDTSIENSPVCADTNTLSVVVLPIEIKSEGEDEQKGDICSYRGHPYKQGQSINECGICQNGTIVTNTTKGTICQICNPVTWLLSNVEDGKKKQQDGTCCIGGKLGNHPFFCPGQEGQCTFGDQTYGNGATVNACGKCNNGTVSADPTKYNSDCQTCNAETYAIINKEGSCDYDGGSQNGLCAKGICIGCSGWIDLYGNCCPDSDECTEECQTSEHCLEDHICNGGTCTCPTGSFELLSGSCNSCSDLYRREATKTECDKCGSERLFVVNNQDGKGYCDWECPTGWFRNDNRNCTECGHLADKKTSQEECDKCTGDLARTWDPTTRYCSLGTECPTGYFLTSVNKLCRSCSDTTAYPAASGDCGKCDGQRMMVGSSCALIGSCPDGYFWVTSTKSCLPCSDKNAVKTEEGNCNTCGGSRWYGRKDNIGQAGYCEPVCPAGWFQNANGNCTDCANSSGKATTTAQCNLCLTTAFKRELRTDGKCYLINPPTSGYFIDSSGVYRSCSDPNPYKPNSTSECSNCGTLRTMVSGKCVLQ